MNKRTYEYLKKLKEKDKVLFYLYRIVMSENPAFIIDNYGLKIEDWQLDKMKEKFKEFGDDESLEKMGLIQAYQVLSLR